MNTELTIAEWAWLGGGVLVTIVLGVVLAVWTLRERPTPPMARPILPDQPLDDLQNRP